MKTVKILWYYFSGLGIVALGGAAEVGAVIAALIAIVISGSPSLVVPVSAGLVGAILGILAVMAYALHVDRCG
jgi:hypothetical protein